MKVRDLALTALGVIAIVIMSYEDFLRYRDRRWRR